MRYLNSTAVLWGILFITSGQCLPAAELRPYGNTSMQDSESPKVKLGEITGVINSIDRVFGRISVQDAKGVVMEFSVETNTRVQDHYLQIGLDKLCLGDHVTVYYNVDPQLVNRIDRI